MADSAANSSKDLARGVEANSVADGGMILGHVGKDDVVLARTGDRFFAVGAHCTHYHGPLAEGIVVDDTVRCPWHHACFSLETGEAIRAPAFDALACWQVEQRDGKIFVTAKKTPSPQPNSEPVMAKSAHPSRVVIVGGGASGFAAAE